MIILFLIPSAFALARILENFWEHWDPLPMTSDQRLIHREAVKEMFDHAFDAYIDIAFPHDELKPLSASYTDSLAELGNAKQLHNNYKGIAMTLIDSLDTLAITGRTEDFKYYVHWIVQNISFDIDLRVNLFECNIRILGGILSAHQIASSAAMEFEDYNDGLLLLAKDLGDRLMPAFKTQSGIPFAWVNLKHGVHLDETSKICTAEVGTLLVEFGTLSQLTGDFKYYDAAYKAIAQLWTMRDATTGLFGNTLNGETMQWDNTNSGIGSGIDSLYEYLIKAYVLFGDESLLDMFDLTYTAAVQNLKQGPWYFEAGMSNARPTHVQFNSLQAFWPGLQSMVGDLADAIDTQNAFFSVWFNHGLLPERFLLSSMSIHSTERYYPLRPELIESCFLLYASTGDPLYLKMGEFVLYSLNNHSRVENGYASIRDVVKMEKEDYMQSYFLAETCKYLFLLFDEENALLGTNFIFSTEGHVFPVSIEAHEMFRDRKPFPIPLDQKLKRIQCQIVDESATFFDWRHLASQSMPERPSGSCALQPDRDFIVNDLKITVDEGAFFIKHKDEVAVIRNLGSDSVEIYNRLGPSQRMFTYHPRRRVTVYSVVIRSDVCLMYNFVAAPAVFNMKDSLKGFEDLVLLKSIHACALEEISGVEGKIVIVERGLCTFQLKAWNLQQKGAKGVIVVNQFEDSNLFVMGSDFTNTDIRIPVMMVDRKAGEMIQHCVSEASEFIRATMKTHQRISFKRKIDFSEHQMSFVPVSYIYGDLEEFVYEGLGGWAVRIKKDGDVHHLHVL